MSPIVALRIKFIIRNMRMVADCLGATSGPATLREVARALGDLQTLVLMALYQWDREIVQNAQYGYDQTEIKGAKSNEN